MNFLPSDYNDNESVFDHFTSTNKKQIQADTSYSSSDDENVHGFALQPIKAVLSEHEESPPSESLRSITLIAEERKKNLSVPKSKKRTTSTSDKIKIDNNRSM